MDYLNLAGLKLPQGLDLNSIQPRTPAQKINDSEGELNLADGIDCPICKNKGYIAEDLTDGSFTIRDCACKEKRRSVQMLKASGLGDLMRDYTFKNFTTPDEWTNQVKETAGRYLKAQGAPWFFVSGTPGTGKTHICTAICRRLLEGGTGVRYMLWREEAPALKALVNDPEYDERFRKWSNAETLYIDDFLKGSVTPADVNLAFALINARYNARGKRTIISSELTVSDISKYDEAVASRIYERAKGFILHAPRDAKNFRKE